MHHSFWWSSLRQDMEDYVRLCRTCSQACVNRQLLEGLLEPLPIPQQAWSHLPVNFLMDLPSSEGFTTVLVIINRFSKVCKLIPLKGLPTALQTVNALFQHVFRNFGLPEEIVSDRGPGYGGNIWATR